MTSSQRTVGTSSTQEPSSTCRTTLCSARSTAAKSLLAKWSKDASIFSTPRHSSTGCPSKLWKSCTTTFTCSSHPTRLDALQKLLTVCRVRAAEYFGKSSRIWCQGCRRCGAVRTSLELSDTSQSQPSRSTSRIKKVVNAQDVQIPTVSDSNTTRVAASTVVRSLPLV